MSKLIYKCEKCNKEFTNNYGCSEHEIQCMNKQDTIDINLGKAIEYIKKKYQVTINKYSAKIYTWDCDGFVNENVQFEIAGVLPNGHEIDNCEYYYDVNSTSVDAFISYIEDELIISYLDTTYQGTIYNDMEYEWRLIGKDSITINELCRRLNGKEVKIEVIK